MFVTLIQNNSGGYFIDDEEKGICEYIIIEVDNDNEFINKLNIIANSINGFYDYCTCCGKRWYIDEDSIEFNNEPLIDDENVYHVKKSSFRKKCFIHFKNGNIEKVDFK